MRTSNRWGHVRGARGSRWAGGMAEPRYRRPAAPPQSPRGPPEAPATLAAMRRWGARRARSGALAVAGPRRPAWPSSPGPPAPPPARTLFSSALRAGPGRSATPGIAGHRGRLRHPHRLLAPPPPGMQITTASVIKAQVLGAVLLQAQDAGRGLTAWERSQIGPMIRYSFNPETSALYGYVGYERRHVRAATRASVSTSTTHTATFGLTRSTAVDRTNVALRLLYGGGGLRQAGPRGGVGVHDRRAPAPGVGHQRRACRRGGRWRRRTASTRRRASGGASGRAASCARTTATRATPSR